MLTKAQNSAIMNKSCRRAVRNGFATIWRNILLWKVKIQYGLREFFENPVENLEQLLYVQLRLVTRVYAAPFRVNFMHSNPNEKWVKPRMEPREGWELCFAIGIQALLVTRASLSLASSYNILVMQKGILTPDTLLFSTALVLMAMTYGNGIVAAVKRKEAAQTFNSYTVFNETYSRKQNSVVALLVYCSFITDGSVVAGTYCGTRTVLATTGHEKLVCVVLLVSSIVLFLVPILAAVVFFCLDDSPISLGYILGGMYSAEARFSSQIWIRVLFFTDCTWLTVGILGNLFTTATCGLPLVGITFATSSLR